ncbi:MAG: YbaN family protein [Pseudomonadota bacterium]
MIAVTSERVGKTGFRFLAYTSAGLAALGVVLPLLPTTPFVILAAYFASRGSPAFAAWLEQHQTFGPAIEQWRQRRAVPLKAKFLALAMMMASWSTLLLLGSPALVLTISGFFLLAVAVYLMTRPSC